MVLPTSRGQSQRDFWPVWRGQNSRDLRPLVGCREVIIISGAACMSPNEASRCTALASCHLAVGGLPVWQFGRSWIGVVRGVGLAVWRGLATQLHVRQYPFSISPVRLDWTEPPKRSKLGQFLTQILFWSNELFTSPIHHRVEATRSFGFLATSSVALWNSCPVNIGRHKGLNSQHYIFVWNYILVWTKWMFKY